MKRILAFVVALMMVMSFAVAETSVMKAVVSPSKTVADMTGIRVGSGMMLYQMEDKNSILKVNETIEKLLGYANPLDFFGPEAAAKIIKILGENVSVDELLPVKSSGVKEPADGKVTVQLSMPTPYKEGEKVAVLLYDGEVWNVYEGVGQEDGSILTTVNLIALKNVTMLAVLSAAE